MQVQRRHAGVVHPADRHAHDQARAKADLHPGPLTAAQDQMLETVDRNAARLRHLIEDVLTLSKIEAGACAGRPRNPPRTGLIG